MSAGAALHVRPMSEADLDQVFLLASKLPSAPQWPRSAYRKALEESASPQRIALVVESQTGEVAGFVMASVVGPEAEFESICVSGEMQRRGLARALIVELSERLGRAGVGTVHLEVRTSNAAARALYAAVGFRESGVRPRYYADPVEDAAVLSMALRGRAPGVR